MFEIHGIFDGEIEERLVKNLTAYGIMGQNAFDITTDFNRYAENYSKFLSAKPEYLIIPPDIKIAKFYAPLCKYIIVKFCGNRKFLCDCMPGVDYNELEYTLTEFKNLKNQILIMLTGTCNDFCMRTGTTRLLTNNQAVLKSLVKQSTIFYDENKKNSYFTYLDESSYPHFVWIEDTRSISEKHNLIKENEFKGICWENTKIMLDGNWESMYASFKAK